MTPIKRGTPSAQAEKDESRREALKRFGRYAAAAPTVMLLLGPRSANADPPNWYGFPGPPDDPPPFD